MRRRKYGEHRVTLFDVISQCKAEVEKAHEHKVRLVVNEEVIKTAFNSAYLETLEAYFGKQYVENAPKYFNETEHYVRYTLSTSGEIMFVFDPLGWYVSRCFVDGGGIGIQTECTLSYPHIKNMRFKEDVCNAAKEKLKDKFDMESLAKIRDETNLSRNFFVKMESLIKGKFRFDNVALRTILKEFPFMKKYCPRDFKRFPTDNLDHLGITQEEVNAVKDMLAYNAVTKTEEQ